MPEGMLPTLMLAATVAIDLGLALFVGALASRLWLRGRDSAWRTDVLAQGHRASRFGFVLALSGLLASAWFEAAAMAGTPLLRAGPSLGALVLKTHYGHAWMVGLVAWSIACLTPVSRSDGEPRALAWAAALAALSVFIATRSVVSHAGSGGDFTLDVALDWVHLALVSLWVGMVFAGARLAVPLEEAPPQARSDATWWVRRMSASATAALVAIAATGLFKVWRVGTPAPSFQQFVDAPYGRMLAVKLALVAVAVVLGGLNRFAVLPRLLRQLSGERRGGPWRARLIAILRWEAVTLTLVLVAASMLGGTEPPGAP